MRLIYKFPIVFLFFVFIPIQASDDLQAKFDAQMSEYELYRKKHLFREAAEAITKAYEIGNQLYLHDEAKRAALTLRVGVARNQADLEQTLPFLNAAQAYYEQTPGSNAQLVEIFLEQAKYKAWLTLQNQQKIEVKDLLRKSFKLAKDDPILLAKANFTASVIYQYEYSYGFVSRQHKYLNRAHKLLSKANAQSTELFASVASSLSRFELRREKFELAERHALEALRAYQEVDMDDYTSMVYVRTDLVKSYESRGMTDMATPHCVEIGRLLEKLGNPDRPTLLYTAKYSFKSYGILGKDEAKIRLRFDVDELGFVQNPQVIGSEGDQAHLKEVLAAVRKYRYAPIHRNGKPVYTKNVPLNFSINIEKKG